MTDEQLRAELVRVRAELDRRISKLEASDQAAQQAWDDAMDRMYGRPRRPHLRLAR